MQARGWTDTRKGPQAGGPHKLKRQRNDFPSEFLGGISLANTLILAQQTLIMNFPPPEQ